MIIEYLVMENPISIGFWLGFVGFVLIMLCLDLFVFHKKDSVMKVKTALLWSVFWIGLAVGFNALVYFWLGHQKALEFLTGYLIEESLSVDNLFVFIMIFGFFRIEPKYQHKILFWGIIGAIVMRAVFIFAGVSLIHKFDWVMYLFGAFLVYTGIKMLFEKEDDGNYNPSENGAVRLFRKVFPVTDEPGLTTFFVKRNGKVMATTFFIVLLIIEGSDLIFAVDSIPAVLSVSKDPFIVYTSNIFAILGLRSLYFALSGIMKYFHYLKYALAGILSFIGVKMCFNEFCAQMDYPMEISNLASLGVIVSLLTISILASIATAKKHPEKSNS
jgi:tellurite resistance protein TerC